MPQLYVLRRFSSWSFRLGVSMALLVSSAGLAASLLVSTAMYSAEGPGPNWPSTPSPAQAASELPAGGPTKAAVLPEPHRGMVPAYSFASTPVAGAPADGHLPDQTASSSLVYPAPAGAFRATIQRSWHTFKLAFR